MKTLFSHKLQDESTEQTYLALDIPEHALIDLLVYVESREEIVTCNDTMDMPPHWLAINACRKITTCKQK
jgi:hypothetical protein